MKKHLILSLASCFTLVLTGCSHMNPTITPDPTVRIGFNGENLDGWRAPHGKWATANAVRLDPSNPSKFVYGAGYGVLVNGGDGPTSNLVSEINHGDVEAELEFNVPKGSNSGVYFMGRYEVQIFDSWGVDEPKDSDVGGIYHRWIDGKPLEGSAPISNAAKEPGEWQKLDVVFRAPRFDSHGNKTENARFVSVKLNGVLIQENAETSGPTRSAHIVDNEADFGPLMLQGDHGPVAYRNIRLRNVLMD